MPPGTYTRTDLTAREVELILMNRAEEAYWRRADDGTLALYRDSYEFSNARITLRRILSTEWRE